MVKKDKNGKYQRTFTTDSKGKKNYNKISFKYGTVESQKSYTFSPDGKTVDTYGVYKVRGDGNGTKLFNFLADHVTGSESMAEISQAKTGKAGKKGLNFLTTSHQEKRESGMTKLLNGQLLRGYTIRELNHSHPITNGASDPDIAFKKQANGIFKRKKLNIPSYNIYHVPSKKKIQY